jgi:hypothetical protein
MDVQDELMCPLGGQRYNGVGSADFETPSTQWTIGIGLLVAV